MLLQGSNVELRDKLHELSAQAEASQAQLAALEGLQSSLQDSAGPSVDALVEAAVSRERAIQDARNRKVLELLNNKVGYVASSGGLSYRKLIKAAGTSCCRCLCAYVMSVFGKLLLIRWRGWRPANILLSVQMQLTCSTVHIMCLDPYRCGSQSHRLAPFFGFALCWVGMAVNMQTVTSLIISVILVILLQLVTYLHLQSKSCVSTLS